jgi:hypothetical protein
VELETIIGGYLNHYLSAEYAMHLHTMRALFASHDAFSALFVSCIQPQLQVTVLPPGILL